MAHITAAARSADLSPVASNTTSANFTFDVASCNANVTLSPISNVDSVALAAYTVNSANDLKVEMRNIVSNFKKEDVQGVKRLCRMRLQKKI